MPRLDKWGVVNHPYHAVPTLNGIVSGHPYFKDGASIITSVIVGYDAKKRVFLTQNGSKYTLGRVHREKLHPQARKKLIASLTQ